MNRIPSEGELELLKVLWQRGPSTVREIAEVLNSQLQSSDKTVGYTTVLKMLQIMFDKQLVKRDESTRSHVYAAAVEAEATEGHFVSQLVNRLFKGSAVKLAMRALSTEKVSDDELQQLRRLVGELERAKAAHGGSEQ